MEHLPDTQAPLKEHLPKFYMAVVGTNSTVEKEVEVHIDHTGPTDRQFRGPTTGNTDAVTSAIRRRGRQRSKVRIPFEPG